MERGLVIVWRKLRRVEDRELWVIVLVSDRGVLNKE